jgi:hypothetical protein
MLHYLSSITVNKPHVLTARQNNIFRAIGCFTLLKTLKHQTSTNRACLALFGLPPKRMRDCCLPIQLTLRHHCVIQQVIPDAITKLPSYLSDAPYWALARFRGRPCRGTWYFALQISNGPTGYVNWMCRKPVQDLRVYLLSLQTSQPVSASRSSVPDAAPACVVIDGFAVVQFLLHVVLDGRRAI